MRGSWAKLIAWLTACGGTSALIASKGLGLFA